MEQLITPLLLVVAPLIVLVVAQNVLCKILAPKIFRSALARRTYYVSAFLGTPIHEVSHAICCLLFGHKITKIKLFKMNPTSGSLGYVSHHWNSRSVYQSAGCFFIAIAPLLAGISIVYFSFVKNEPFEYALFNFNSNIQLNNIIDIRNLVTQSAELTLNIITKLMDNWLSFGKLMVVSLICFHCIPSNSDFYNALKGSCIVILLIWGFILNFDFLVQMSSGYITQNLLTVGLGYLCGVVILSFSIWLLSLLWWIVLALLSTITGRE